ncbi:MAG TPA: hypothetical protein DGB72_13605 [Gemmatimonadetes bacterium]|nr:hypothetical protein [Gemmatimonadota bacterium]
MESDQACRHEYATSADMMDGLSATIGKIPHDHGNIVGTLLLTLRISFLNLHTRARKVGMLNVPA